MDMFDEIPKLAPVANDNKELKLETGEMEKSGIFYKYSSIRRYSSN